MTSTSDLALGSRTWLTRLFHENEKNSTWARSWTCWICHLKPGFHMIVRIVPIVPVVSKNVQAIGTIIWKHFPDDRRRSQTTRTIGTITIVRIELCYATLMLSWTLSSSACGKPLYRGGKGAMPWHYIEPWIMPSDWTIQCAYYWDARDLRKWKSSACWKFFFMWDHWGQVCKTIRGTSGTRLLKKICTPTWLCSA